MYFMAGYVSYRALCHLPRGGTSHSGLIPTTTTNKFLSDLSRGLSELGNPENRDSLRKICVDSFTKLTWTLETQQQTHTSIGQLIYKVREKAGGEGERGQSHDKT